MIMEIHRPHHGSRIFPLVIPVKLCFVQCALYGKRRFGFHAEFAQPPDPVIHSGTSRILPLLIEIPLGGGRTFGSIDVGGYFFEHSTMVIGSIKGFERR